MSASISASGSISKALPAIPLPAASTWQQIRDLYDAPGEHIFFLHMSSGATAKPNTFNKCLREVPGIKTLLESAYYLEVVKIYTETICLEDLSYSAVGLTPNQALSSVNFSSIFKFTSHVVSKGTPLVPGTNIAELPFHQGLSRQVNPTPVDGIMPQLCASFSSPTAGTGTMTICVVCRVAGPVIQHVDI